MQRYVTHHYIRFCNILILGEGIYNFGELLAHPILDAVKQTDKQWIVDLLYAFNSGDIAKFEKSTSLLQQQVCIYSFYVVGFRLLCNGSNGII